MHPDDTTPNPIPFTTARGWSVSADNSVPTPPTRVAELARVARAWQVGLLIGSILTAPALAASILFSLTTH